MWYVLGSPSALWAISGAGESNLFFLPTNDFCQERKRERGGMGEKEGGREREREREAERERVKKDVEIGERVRGIERYEREIEAL